MVRILFLVISFLGALLSGVLCGLLGYYIKRLKLTNLAFTIAHAALAGAVLSLFFNINMVFFTMLFTIMVTFVVVGISIWYPHIRELVCMSMFSFFSALAILVIYLSSDGVLTSTSLATILWGSVLALTFSKMMMIIVTIVMFLFYTLVFKPQLDSILFDIRLANAEGVRVGFHLMIIVLFVSVSVSIILRITGGFLVFALLYNPIASSMMISQNAYKQQLFSGIIGGSAALIGFILSFSFDLPIGASIAVSSSVILVFSVILRTIWNQFIAHKSVEVTDLYEY